MQAFRNILFFGILIMLIVMLSYCSESLLLHNKSMVPAHYKNVYGVRNEPENSLDVIILGDSLSYSSIAPPIMWREHGFTSYVCGQAGQRIWESEEILKTVFRTQSPKLVILETHVMFNLRNNVKDFQDMFEEKLGFYVPAFGGHDVWKPLLAGKEYKTESYKGFSFRRKVNPYTNGEYMHKTDKTEELPDAIKTHLSNIINICRKNGAELVLISTPSPVCHNYERHNMISAFADDSSLPYLDMNLITDRIGIDWNTDSLDHGDHLNYSGAEKVTKYLGNYLSKTYELPDHRSDPGYSCWENESREFERKAYENKEKSGEK